MRPIKKIILATILMSTIFGCGQQSTSEDFVAAPVIPQLESRPTQIPITPTPINHPLVTEHTPAPINQPLAEATRIPPSTYVPQLIDDGVPELVVSVNDIFFEDVLEGEGLVTIGESTISGFIGGKDRVLIKYRMPSLMTGLTEGSFRGQLSLKHSRDIFASHKDTRIYKDGTVFLAHIDDFSEDHFGQVVITNDLTLVQSEIQSNTGQIVVPAPVVATVADQQNVPIALGVPTTVNTSSGPLEIHLEESYLYTSDQPGSDASTGYKMQVWIQKVKP